MRKKYPATVLLDFSRGELEIARERSGDLRIVQGDVRRLPARNSADYIVCTDVLQHLPEDGLDEAMVSLKAALQPGGRLVFSVWNSNSFRAVFGAEPRGVFKSGISYSAFDEERLETLFAKHGFQPEFIGGLGYGVSAVRKIKFTTRLYNLLGWLTIPLELLLTGYYRPRRNKYAMYFLVKGKFHA